MPDRHQFNWLPWRGVIYHRCIEEGCDFPGEEKTLTEKERERHHKQHIRERERKAERDRGKNLAQARRVKRQKEREGALIEQRFGQEMKSESES